MTTSKPAIAEQVRRCTSRALKIPSTMALLYSLTGGGCTGPAPLADQEVPLPQAGDAPLAHASDPRLPPGFVEDGRRYTPLRKNHPEQFVMRAPDGADGSSDAMQAEVPDLAAMDDGEYAEAMAGITLVDGYIYRVTPTLETVRAIRSDPALGAEGALPQGEWSDEPESDHDLLQDPVQDELRAYLIIGDDERKVQRKNTVYPWRTIVAMNWGCTGTMVGKSTLVSAAHCFYDGKNWRPAYVFEPGADRLDATEAERFPFGHIDCYVVTLPELTGYDSKGRPKKERDFAVVDFRGRLNGVQCNASPGVQTGYMGTLIRGDSEIQDHRASLFGYPGGDGLDPVALALFKANAYPQLWGMKGRITTVSPVLLEYTMDTEGGQSGAGVFVTDSNGLPNLVGVHSGGSRTGYSRNFGPRFTVEWWNFMKAHTVEY